MRAAAVRLDDLTKPRGSLGRLEDLARVLAGITGDPLPRVAGKVVVVIAADHGVTAQGVSAYPASVTAQMVANFLAGGAAVNVLACLAGVRVVVVDVGVDAELAPHPELRARKVRRGTRDLASEPAMTAGETLAALEVGLDLAAELAHPTTLVALGEMGIGNTTAASALIALLAGVPAAEVTGRGTGIDDATLAHKRAVSDRALALHRGAAGDPLAALAAVGGLEIAALAGLTIGAAARRSPVIVDGLIAGAAAYAAVAIAPAARPYLIAGHRSVEVGHALTLARLGLEPLLVLRLRLGEGTGAVLAMQSVEAATAVLREMATFSGAAVDRSL